MTIDLSADERFYLTIDGAFVALGPNRAVVEIWQYQTYEISRSPGEYVMEATVWRTGDYGPFAQLSHTGGFVLKASGEYDRQLTTGKGEWEVGRLDGIVPNGCDGGAWGTGVQWLMTGTGLYDAAPAHWEKPVVVRGPAGIRTGMMGGARTPGWMLFPTQLPDQLRRSVRPGMVKAVATGTVFRAKHVYTQAETGAEASVALNALLREGRAFSVPPHTRFQAVWDLGDYYCAYPQLTVSGGKDARVAWCWSESSRVGGKGIKGSEPNARGSIVGRYIDGYGDTFVCDGRERAVFSTPWFRCGRWCRIDVETGDDPLVLKDMHLVETRYPLEDEGAFESPDEPVLADIRRISLRTMQMCSHEMLFDCPFYEQQMYPGDSRVQLNVVTALTRDERMIRRVIEIFALSSRDDGQAPFNWPTRGLQEGATYTLCYLCMYGDYVMYHADREWLRARLPSLRQTMSGIEYYENGDGLLENMPGWQFMDWVVGWNKDGTAPSSRFGEGVSAPINLFWVHAMKSAAVAERSLGNELQARYWEEKCDRTAQAIVRTFWNEERGLFADTPAMKDYSEHSQSLALLVDILPPEKAKLCFERLVSENDLKRATVYFSYFLFSCYFKFDRGDLFLKKLDLWRQYLAKGLSTTQEAPDVGDDESRSDCHAWGAHPVWFMQTGLAGIRSAAPFFGKVLVEPSPGHLRELKARHPHPKGFVEVDLRFDGGKASGVVKTPVAGIFAYRGLRQELKAGENRIR